MITDGKAEREFRTALRDQQAKLRKLSDALWGCAISESIGWDAAREALERAGAAFEREIGGATEALALDACRPESVA